MTHKENTQVRNPQRAAANVEPSLDHGVPSIVAMDNPDDSQLGTEHQDRHQPNRPQNGNP